MPGPAGGLPVVVQTLPARQPGDQRDGRPGREGRPRQRPVKKDRFVTIDGADKAVDWGLVQRARDLAGLKVESALGRGFGVAADRFPKAALRTRRATLIAPGSPQSLPLMRGCAGSRGWGSDSPGSGIWRATVTEAMLNIWIPSAAIGLHVPSGALNRRLTSWGYPFNRSSLARWITLARACTPRARWVS